MDPNQELNNNPKTSDQLDDVLTTDNPEQVNAPVEVQGIADPTPFGTPESVIAAPGEPVLGTPDPVVAPAAPASPTQNDVISATPAASPVPVVQLAPKQPSKSLLWLWVTLGAVILVIIGLVIGYVVVKGAGDSAAKTYTVAAKNYVDDVYDASTTAADSPNDVVKAMEKIDKPILEEVFMSDLSSEYKAASELDIELIGKIAETQDKLRQYGTVYDLYTELLAAEDEVDGTAKTADVLAESLIAYLTHVDEIVKDNANVPADLKEDLASFASSNSDLKDIYTELLAAYNAKSQSRYNAAVAQVTTKTQTFQAEIGKISTYYNGLAEKISTVTKDLKAYADTVK